MTFLVVFPVALALSLMLTPTVRRLALRLSFVDVPDGKRFHSAAVPLLGGVAVVASVLLAWIAAHLVYGIETTPPELVVVLGFLLSFGLGLHDDRKGMPAKVKLSVQTACALLLVSGCYAAGWMRGGLLFPLAVVWVVAIMNATNFLDNMDGVAGGVAAAACLALGLQLSAEQHWVGGVLAASLLGASLGFLRYNFPPAGIFLGDAGSLPVGYLLAALSIMAAGGPDFESVAPPVLTLAYPVFDISFVTLVRTREHRRIYQGGKDHTSHRLATVLGSARGTALVIYLVCLAFGASGLVVYRVGRPLVSLAAVVVLAALLVALGVMLYRATTRPTERAARAPGD
ncbi:MAG: undecaprenyl/decaprenyl-phosphate alpha-N-acetylglucosaminyl 1-phosphate transferase [Candidatus Eisenbacteria bacterium]|nr:undecaprenyl/decaprenyl-phosphate alpha-N-acetylglucosaminyl 1-phosphate transferase [Candidatus Eisenbacteria bacterium]